MKRKPIAAALLLAIATAMPPSVMGQAPAKPYRIGVLVTGSDRSEGHLLAAFDSGLREHGLQSGKDVVYEKRFADGRLERLTRLAGELVASKVDLVFAPQTPAALAAKKATAAIPVVFALAADPVAVALVASFARPGGNVTGFASNNGELVAKRLELLKEIVPAIARAGIVFDPENPGDPLQLRDFEAAARTLKLEVVPIAVSEAAQYRAGFNTLAKHAVRAMFVVPNPLNVTSREVIARYARSARIASVHSLIEDVQAGGLISYGANYEDLCRRAGGHAARILRGAKPADLPVEQPTRFELVVNLKTARALGIALPQAVLLRVDRVIE